MTAYVIFRTLLRNPADPGCNMPVSRDCQLDRDATFSDRAEAQRLATQFQDNYGGSPAVQTFDVREADSLRPIEPTWQDRELRRFALGEYTATPWDLEPWYEEKRNEHFVHMSVKQPGMIAYTENEAKGAADRQTSTRAGRYLTKFFSDVLSANEIEQWVAKVSISAGEAELKITQDPDEIEDVYIGGPNSCMSHGLDSFNGHCHPVRVYAGPDLALAYLGSRDDATARAVVWPERKRYGRIYGDISRMTLMLKDAGYEDGSFDGARITRIVDENGNGFIMPYLDFGMTAYTDGERLQIGYFAGGHSVESQSTDGVTDDCSGPTCERCGGSTHGDTYTVRGRSYDESWCECCSDNHSTTCESSGERYSDDYHVFQTVYARSRYSSFPSEASVHEDNLDAYGAVYVEDEDEHWVSDDTFFCEITERTYVIHHTGSPVEWQGQTCTLAAAEEAMAGLDDDEAHYAHVTAYRELPRPAPVCRPAPTLEVIPCNPSGMWEVVKTGGGEQAVVCCMWTTCQCSAGLAEAELTQRELGRRYPRFTYVVQPAGTFAASQLALAA